MRIAMLISALLAFCPPAMTGEPPEGKPHIAQTSEGGVQLTISLPKRSFEPLEPVVMHVMLRNGSDRRIAFLFYTSFRSADVSVRDVERERDVPRTLFGQKHFYGASGSDTKGTYLEPGKDLEFDYTLNRAFDVSLSSEYQAACGLTYASPQGVREIRAKGLGFHVK